MVGISIGGGLLQRLQPGRQFGIGFDIQAAAGRNRVEAFGNQHVNIAEMLLERRKRRGIPAHIKSGAQGIVGGGHLAQRRHATVPAGPLTAFRFGIFSTNRMKRAAVGGKQRLGQSGTD
jgi:hypothetical protein